MRIRTIKPEFFLHDRLFEAEKAELLPLRISFVGLWCAADREGRFKWEPRRLGAQILPYDGIDFSCVLEALSKRGFIRMYRINDDTYGDIPSFSRHQVINNRESKSVIPSISADDQTNPRSLTRAPRVPDACPTPLDLDEVEGKGMEEEEEGKGNASEASAPASLSDQLINLTIPDTLDTPAFHEAWELYGTYRRQAKLKKLKPMSLEAQWKVMADWGVEAAIASIHQTIANGWQGLFAPKPQGPGGGSKNYANPHHRPATTAESQPMSGGIWSAPKPEL